MMNAQVEEKLKNIKGKKIYIFGAGKIGSQVKRFIAEKDFLGFIDNSNVKQIQGYKGYNVLPLSKIEYEIEPVIVIGVGAEYRDEIYNQLKSAQQISSQQIFDYKVFLQIYLYKTKNEIYFSGLSISVTQICSLNCRYCSIMTPYLKNRKHYLLEDIKEDMNIFFKKVDYLENLGIVGGEPFIYPDILEFIKFIAKYNEKVVNNITIITNGTVIPNEDVLHALSENSIMVSISDYRSTLPRLGKKIDDLIEKLVEYNVKYEMNVAQNWIDFGYDLADKRNLSENQMKEFFEKCNMPCRLMFDRRLYYCANAKFAVDAGLEERDMDNELELENVTDGMEIIKFDQGEIPRGYVKLCRHCNGFLNCNQNFVPVAEQI